MTPCAGKVTRRGVCAALQGQCRNAATCINLIFICALSLCRVLLGQRFHVCVSDFVLEICGESPNRTLLVEVTHMRMRGAIYGRSVVGQGGPR